MGGLQEQIEEGGGKIEQLSQTTQDTVDSLTTGFASLEASISSLLETLDEYAEKIDETQEQLSYLEENLPRWIDYSAVILTMILVWLVVMALSGVGRAATASLIGSPKELSAAQAVIVSDLVNWQKWSTLLATISSVLVLITGLVTQMSGWVVRLNSLVKDWLTLRRIYRRAYRDWRA